MSSILHSVILSGGSGTRLWPLSRRNLPKQFLAPLQGPTLLQATAQRVAGDPFAAPLLVCHEDHRFIASEQLRTIGIEPARMLLEPMGRNTAPAATMAALAVAEKDPEALMLILPADQTMDDTDVFRTAVESGRKAAEQGELVTFGVKPERAETGYGYIGCAEPLADASPCRRVARFVEKPNANTAESFLASGDYLWNSGIFLFPVRVYLDEIARFEPALLESCKKAFAVIEQDLWFDRIPVEPFSEINPISIDYAVMERTDRAAVVPLDLAWSDLGSWAGIWRAADKDEEGNASLGDVTAIDTRESCLFGDGILVAALGIDNLIVAARDDAVLVAPRERAEDVRKLATALEKKGDRKHLEHPLVFRPWGHYQTVFAADGFLVKRIEVNPKGKLSLQKHDRRAEHWIVVSGNARIVRGEEKLELKANESTFIPSGMKHSLENPDDTPMTFIEVQTGDLLSEDDIVRFEDVYGRAGRKKPSGD